jgi:hypothetical protein
MNDEILGRVLANGESSWDCAQMAASFGKGLGETGLPIVCLP